MSEINKDEIDLLQVIQAITKGFKKLIIKVFEGIDFIKRNRLILLLLIIIGVGFGYYKQSNKITGKTTKILLYISPKAVNYAYVQTELLDKKIKENDTLFLKNNGFSTGDVRITGIKLTPLLKFSDIVGTYGSTNKTFEALIKNLMFDKSNIIENFATDLREHILQIDLIGNDGYKEVETLLTYFNETPLIKKLNIQAQKNNTRELEIYNNTLLRIREIMSVYSKSSTTVIADENDKDLIVVDKNFSLDELLEKERNILRILRNLENEAIMTEKVITPVNPYVITNIETGLSGNSIVLYPILFVFLFLGVNFLKYTYNTLKAYIKHN